ncbi:MAG: TolB family protein [Bacteroidales bacterium]
MKKIILIAYTFLTLTACNQVTKQNPHSADKSGKQKAPDTTVHYAQEKHLANIKQLTFGGDNAEAYFSFSSEMIVFQSNNPAWNLDCDQIFYTRLDHAKMDKETPQRISTGLGRTTCSYFMPGDSTIVFASTHMGNESCPLSPPKREDGKYVWPIYSDYEIFVADLNGKIVNTLTNFAGYDAEATVSPKGDKIVFTSLRTGDLELFTMNIDGSDVKQVTTGLGYDGGAFFSPDGTKLVFRASRPQSPEEQADYKKLLKEGLVLPTNMEIYTCNVDGSDLRKVTSLGKANWAPFFTPSGDKIIFSSNHHSEKGWQFNLFMVNLDGSGLEQISFDKVFDAFPMFSFDGKKLIFSSNRNNGGSHNTNLFIADWVN